MADPSMKTGKERRRGRQAWTPQRVSEVAALGRQRGRWPDYIMIGAAKAGTSTLKQYLHRHPEVVDIGEPGFFSDDTRYHQWGVDWYRGCFAKQAKPGQICGEKSTAYSRYPERPHAAERMAEHLPNVKLAYVMRHPIDRAYSHYVWRVTQELYPGQPVPVSFEEHIEEDTMCINSSDYMMQLERYLEYYPLDRFCFVFFEDLVADPSGTVRRVLRHIGADESIDPTAEGAIHNKKSSRMQESRVRERMMKPFHTVPVLKQVRAAVPKHWRDWAYTVIRRSPLGRRAERAYVPPAMKPETRRRLVERFREPNRRLGELVGRDLSHWNA